MTINITNIDTHIAVCPLHTKAVTEAISNYTPNRVLGTPPLDISPLESFLPRPVRTTLAQLRSGHCRLLKLYMAHITTGISDVCSECGVATHSVGHLFSCSAHPTRLTVQDLWDNPAEVADFLNLDSWRQWKRREELLGYHNNNITLFRCRVVIWQSIWVGTNLIYDFTAVIFSVKFGFVHEKLILSWNSVIFREFLPVTDLTDNGLFRYLSCSLVYFFLVFSSFS